MRIAVTLSVAAVALLMTGCQDYANAQPNTTSENAKFLNVPSDWQVTQQPQLKSELENAEKLFPEELGYAAFDVNPSGTNRVYDKDANSYDVIVWYRKTYRADTRAYIVDLGTGEVTKQTFEDAEDRARVEMAFTWFGTHAFDGMLYGAITDQRTWDQGGIMRIYRFDPRSNKIELYKKIKGHGGERNPTVLSPNGWIYGAATSMVDGDAHHASAYGFNPETGEVKNFGAIGPRIKEIALGYTIGACDTHIYVACGKIPWYLVAVNVETGEEKVLLEAPEGSFGLQISGSQDKHFGGAVARTQQTTDRSTQEYFWLYHGEAIRKSEPNWDMDSSCPWPDDLFAKAPKQSRPVAPEIHSGELYPDENNLARLWWRPDRPRQSRTANWQSVDIEGVEKHPLTIHRFARLSDGRFFGTSAGSRGSFLFDPPTKKITYLGNGGPSAYAFATQGDRLFYSGYAGAKIFEFDPSRPWNLERGGPPGYNVITTGTASVSEPKANPRRVHNDMDAVFNATRVKKMLSATSAADGRLYFGGLGQRDYQGGGISWYDPSSGAVGGMWEPFAGKNIGWLTTAEKGRYVVIGTTGGEIFLYDTDSQELLTDKTFSPLPDARHSGPLLEVAPGRMMGITWQGTDKSLGVIYGVDVPSGHVLFTKEIPWGLPFEWERGTGLWDYKMGPDGFVWATLANASRHTALVRIDPRDADVKVLGRLVPSGKMEFAGRDLYLTGTEQIRCLRDIVPESVD